MKDKFGFNDKWALLVFLPVVSIGIPLAFPYSGEYFTSDHFRSILVSVYYTASIWLGCRTILHWLWRKFPWNKRPFRHIIFEILFVFSWTTLVVIIGDNLLEPYLLKQRSFQEAPEVQIVLVYVFTFLVVTIHEGYFLFLNWKQTLLNEQKLQIENEKARYESLKQQLNPHFLFNSFNMLSALIEEDHSKASVYLSDMTRFFRMSLQMQEQRTVKLSEEIELARRYLSLQSIRFGDTMQVTWDLACDTDRLGAAPMTLQILLENIFKHNALVPGKPLQITVRCADQWLIVENTCIPRLEDTSGTGLGLTNLIERYLLLTGEEVSVNRGAVFSVSVPLLIR
ncbi:MAG: hypothetical protein CVU11_04260 [Bacteroidetes bacterium HGW-Bacteroidetes-6]|jgi:sensor histidine kinase YesM|nr:MAG: hypothetical protein CVU11_04260 [Bacteroidetes bacterium HGW-Bacteroidetes-6]